MITAGCAAAPSPGPTISAEELTKKLVAGSPWKGKFGPAPTTGMLTVRFASSGGALAGELVSISGLTTARPGPLGPIEVQGDTISFITPSNNVRNEARLEGNKRAAR